MTCPPVQLSHGQVNANKLRVNGKYPYDTTISFSCDSGYSLDTTGIGSGTSTTCLQTGYWSHSTPRCNQSKETLKISK